MKPLRELPSDELFDLVAADIQAYQSGAADLEGKHLELTDDPDVAIEIGRLWLESRAKRPQPATPKPEDHLRPPEIEAASNVSGNLISQGVMDILRATYEAAEKAGIEYEHDEEDDAAHIGDAITKRVAEPEEGPEPPKSNLPALVPSRQLATWNDAIAAMNEQHAIIENWGGKTVIASWEPMPVDLNRLMVVPQSKDSFLLRYSNRTVSIEVSDGRGGMRFDRAPLGHWWLGHRDRLQFRGVTSGQEARRLSASVSIFGRVGVLWRSLAIGH